MSNKPMIIISNTQQKQNKNKRIASKLPYDYQNYVKFISIVTLCALFRRHILLFELVSTYVSFCILRVLCYNCFVIELEIRGGIEWANQYIERFQTVLCFIVFFSFIYWFVYESKLEFLQINIFNKMLCSSVHLTLITTIFFYTHFFYTR